MKTRIGIVLSTLAVAAAVPLLAAALRRNGHHVPAGDGEDLSAWWRQRETLRTEPREVWLAPRVAADVREVDGTATFV